MQRLNWQSPPGHVLLGLMVFLLSMMTGCGGPGESRVIQEDELKTYAAENPDTGVYDESLIGGG